MTEGTFVLLSGLAGVGVCILGFIAFQLNRIADSLSHSRRW